MSKGAHYVQLLDDARCESKWEGVPELVRKIRKHAPDRACLALTAEIECAIEKATKSMPASGQQQRPSTAVSAKDLEVAAQLPRLLSAIEEEVTHPEDKYQARVCVGWLHWVVGEYNLAAVRLPRSFEAESLGLSTAAPAVGLEAEGLAAAVHGDDLKEWTRVCALKAAYLRANCLARNGNRLEALRVFGGGIPPLSTTWSSLQSRRQLRYWSELFLTEFCMLFSHSLDKGESTLDDPNCLASFRSWARYWEVLKGTSSSIAGGLGFRGSVPRREMWRQYYAALSAIVEEDMPFPTGYVAPVPNESSSSARNQLRAELKNVEATYEALLLNETEFPRADEEREEVEEFVRLVSSNWSILCGRGWRNQDLGPGGREALSRGVLDTLYRASMKTYHSTAILRSLFTVHAAVAEFDLALKAFDSYLELVKKGKARVQKTGHPEPSLDDEAIVLETIASCIATLCRYGHLAAAEKARDLAAELEEFVNKLPQGHGYGHGHSDSVSPLREDHSAVGTAGDKVPPRVLALAWQAIGLANAQWARLTLDPASRGEVRAKAVRCLKRSLSGELGRSGDVRGVFALGVLLAEQRELTAAIELAKTALLLGKGVVPGGANANVSANDGLAHQQHDLHNGAHWRERALIPVWHLLSLLLSARQDFVLAARACEGAFEQFRDPAVLFGSESVFRSDHLNEAEARQGGGGGPSRDESEQGRGLVDDMDDFEKEGVLEVKMTQLALVELLEGPKVAVNASLELLGLFTRLFGVVQPKALSSAAAPPSTAQTGLAPKSSAGTVRSIKGSIFGSRSGGRPATRQQQQTSEGLETIPSASRPQTMQTIASTQAPTIQITGENGAVSDFGGTGARPGSRKSATVADRRRSQSGKRASLRKRDSSAGARRRALSVGPPPPQHQQHQQQQHQPTVVDGESYFTPLSEGAGSSIDFFAFAGKRPPSAGLPISLSRSFSQAESFASSSKGGGATGADLVATSGEIEYAAGILPLVQFTPSHERRRRAAILVRVWLMIAGFYRRASLHDDAKAAIAEAQRLVQALEAEVAKDGSVAVREAGWASAKSVEELWGDVWAEMGNLSLAKGLPYAARSDFETALTHFPDHPAAIVGLSNILMDIYNETLPPPPAIPGLHSNGTSNLATSSSREVPSVDPMFYGRKPDGGSASPWTLPSEPLGLWAAKSPSTTVGSSSSPPQPKSRQYPENNSSGGGGGRGLFRSPFGGNSSPLSAASDPFSADQDQQQQQQQQQGQEDSLSGGLPPPHKATSLPVVDRLAARDRAYALVSSLTRLGSAWNNSEAWFALARAHEESGQLDRAREVLWWCVELEEALGVRDWRCLGNGGYVL